VPLADGLPNVESALDLLRDKPDLAWRAFAAGVLADSFEDEEE
jgi:hypothetical protein